jgi:uncharacterized protein with HEPN domain
MLDASREAIAFTEGRKREDLDSDRMLALSLVKSIEIIGEAGSRVTEQGKRETEDIPWAEIIATRNRLIHAYYDIDLDIVWETVREDLPPLVTALEHSIPPDTLS